MVAELQRRDHAFYSADFIGQNRITTVAFNNSQGISRIFLEISSGISSSSVVA